MQIGSVNGGALFGSRVVITGVGAVSCCGVGAGALWAGLLEGTFTEDRTVPEFDASVWFGPKEVRRVDRFAQLSVAAAQESMDDAGELGVDPDRFGVIFGTGIGGMGTLMAQQRVLEERGANRVTPFLAPMIMPNAAAAQIAMRFGARGPVEAVTTACAAGTHSIGTAARLVASGRIDACIAGGGESVLEKITYAGFGNMTALSTQGFSRPFDVDRDGFVMSEGAGSLVLERLDRALERGATIYAEVLGAASTADAFHITAPREDGAGARRCMELALEDAGVAVSDVGSINAHGTSTPLNDLAESVAIRGLFGDAAPSVTSCKGATGHSLGAAGALEAVASVRTIVSGIVPPTAGLLNIDPAIDLDVVIGEPRPLGSPIVLSNSFGFGGHNGSLVFGALA
jgi:3-oxoacyl-[acyl-carrier-protein] synthase II